MDGSLTYWNSVWNNTSPAECPNDQMQEMEPPVAGAWKFTLLILHSIYLPDRCTLGPTCWTRGIWANWMITAWTTNHTELVSTQVCYSNIVGFMVATSALQPQNCEIWAVLCLCNLQITIFSSSHTAKTRDNPRKQPPLKKTFMMTHAKAEPWFWFTTMIFYIFICPSPSISAVIFHHHSHWISIGPVDPEMNLIAASQQCRGCSTTKGSYQFSFFDKPWKTKNGKQRNHEIQIWLQHVAATRQMTTGRIVEPRHSQI